MNTFSTPPRHGLAGLVVIGCTALFLAGCSRDFNWSEGGSETASAQLTAVETVAKSQNESPTVAEQDAKQTENQDAKKDEDNAQATSSASKDAHCENNPLTGKVSLPIHFANNAATDGRFYYSPATDAPDLCAPLSWVKLTGTTSQEGSGPGSTAGSFSETVALFGNGHLITEPAPILARRIDSVERLDERTVRLTYAFYNDQPAVLNQSTAGSATFYWDGSEITVSDNTLPQKLNQTAVTLDLTGVE